MKSLLFISLVIISLKSYCQKNDINPITKSDSVFIIDPIGYIGIDDENKIIPDAALTEKYLSDFKGVFTSYAPYRVSFLAPDTSIHPDYFVDLMQRLNRVPKGRFQNLKISAQVIQLLDPLPGRYFGIICFSGFELQDPLKKIMRSNSMKVLSLVAGGAAGIWSVDLSPNSYLHNYYLIIDKQTRTIASFRKDKKSQSPLLIKTIQSEVKNLVN